MSGVRVLARTRSLYGAEGPLDLCEKPTSKQGDRRAVFLELLDELPRRETFHQADMLMEGLPNLSPRRLQKLLPDCRSVKVKRLLRDCLIGSPPGS